VNLRPLRLGGERKRRSRRVLRRSARLSVGSSANTKAKFHDCGRDIDKSGAERRRFGKIPKATEYCGLCRSSLYVLAAQHPGLFVKAGGATLVNFEMLDAIMDTWPAADIKPSPVQRRATSHLRDDEGRGDQPRASSVLSPANTPGNKDSERCNK
jgi:hypothetical protein